MSTPSIWTDRGVIFEPTPRTTEAEWDAFFEALPDHYWSRPGFVRRFLEPCISSCEREVHVTGLPWWMPGWWARRTVANIAARHGVGGDARSIVVRTVLP